jgi:transposase-like protein
MNHGKEARTSQGAVTMNTDQAKRRAGRPRAIDENLMPKVISLHWMGLGYRAIARELAKEGLCVDWSTVRRAIKAYQGKVNEKTAPGDF